MLGILYLGSRVSVFSIGAFVCIYWNFDHLINLVMLINPHQYNYIILKIKCCTVSITFPQIFNECNLPLFLSHPPQATPLMRNPLPKLLFLWLSSLQWSNPNPSLSESQMQTRNKTTYLMNYTANKSKTDQQFEEIKLKKARELVTINNELYVHNTGLDTYM